MRLFLVRRRGQTQPVHIASFNNLPLCQVSKGLVKSHDALVFERVDGTMNCAECLQWAKAFEESWIKSGDPNRRHRPSRD